MRILLTSVAHRTFGGRLARDGVEWLTLEEDGVVRGEDGSVVDAASVRPEVAWGTSDLYRRGAPIREFFTLLRTAEGLLWFQSPAAGFDHPVFAELARRGVRVTNAHVNSIPIAEFVLRSVLDEFQRAAEWRRQQEEQDWAVHDWREVLGTTWLVVGLGSIGSEVAVRARAFGARVIGCRRHPDPSDPADMTVTPDGLADVVGEADVVVLSAPATAETTRLVDASFLARMKPGCLLVNVARGALVDEAALLDGLEKGTPGAAVLDVFDTEPLPADHPFWTHPRVRVTPHNAAGGTGRHARQADLFADNLDRYLAGNALINDVTDLAAL